MRSSAAAGNTSSEKERMKREEEEMRRRQYAYEMQVTDKRNQLRKDFELHKSNEALKPSPDSILSTSDFCSEINRLQDINSKKVDTLRKLQASLNKDLLSSGSSFQTSNLFSQSKQQPQRSTMKSVSVSSKQLPMQQYGSASVQSIQESEMHSRLDDISNNIESLEGRMFNETEQYQSLLNMQKDLTFSQNQYREKVNHLKRMNEIADTRYKDITHIDVQANENKRLIKWNVEQVKEQIAGVEHMYKSFREKKTGISKALKLENEQEENFLSNVQIKIEEYTKQNEQLIQEIELLDLERHKRELRQKESYFIGLYLWSFEQIERFIRGVNAKSDNGIVEIDALIENNSQSHPFQHTEEDFGQQSHLQQGSGVLGSRYKLSINLSDSRLQTPSKSRNPSKTRMKKQAVRSLAQSYLADEYEVEPPQFDRSEVLSKIHQYYNEHGNNIESTIEMISEFFTDLNIQNLLLKNQYEQLIMQKQILNAEIVQNCQEIAELQEKNFFIDEKNANSENTDKEKLAIVNELLTQAVSMDSGMIIKNPENQSNKQAHISTVNVEAFHNLSSESINQEELNQKQQKFVFHCYLGLVELVKRLCVMVPLIENRLETMQQRLNIFFDFEYVPSSLVKSCSELFFTATNGKSLDQEFQRINESASKQQVQQSQHSTPSIQPPAALLHRNSSIFQANQLPRRSNQYQQLSYLSLDEIVNQPQDRSSSLSSQVRFSSSVHQSNNPNDEDTIPLPMPPLYSENRQSSTPSMDQQQLRVDEITSFIMHDKMARYLLHEQFVRRFVQKTLENTPEATKNDILVQVKAEAMQMLNAKTAQIFKQYSGVHEQLKFFITTMKKTLSDRRIEIRSNPMGSSHPPSIGGVLSLPRSDYIIRSYLNAFDKQLKYSRNEEEDCLQKFAKTSSQDDRDSLIISHQPTSLLVDSNHPTSAVDQQKKNAIYKFISDISDAKKNKYHLHKNSETQPSNNKTEQSNTAATATTTANVATQPTVTFAGVPSMPSNQDPSNQSAANVSQPSNTAANNQNILDKQSNRITEDDFIEEERKQMKITERQEYDDFRFKHIREKEERLQEEKKKRIVYHRLIQNAETDHSRQEHSAIKQFAVDSDILFKIANLEGSTSNAMAEGLNENIKQETSKLSTKFTKEFSQLPMSYLKTNKIYHIRKELSTRDRQRLKNTEFESKYYLHAGSSKNPSVTSDLASRQESAQAARSHNYSSSHKSKYHLKTSSDQLNSSAGFVKTRRPQRQQSHATTTTIFHSGGKSYSVSTEDLPGQYQPPLPSLSNKPLHTSASLLIPPMTTIQAPHSATMSMGSLPVHFKYLQQDWNNPLSSSLSPTLASNLIDLPFHQPSERFNLEELSGPHKAHQNIIRKAFTSQSQSRMSRKL